MTPEDMLAALQPEMPALGWERQAVCANTDPEIFFPEKANQWYGNRINTAYCKQCPVKNQCLTAGWEESDGIWAGTTPGQRETARRLAKLNAA